MTSLNHFQAAEALLENLPDSLPHVTDAASLADAVSVVAEHNNFLASLLSETLNPKEA